MTDIRKGDNVTFTISGAVINVDGSWVDIAPSGDRHASMRLPLGSACVKDIKVAHPEFKVGDVVCSKTKPTYSYTIADNGYYSHQNNTVSESNRFVVREEFPTDEYELVKDMT